MLTTLLIALGNIIWRDTGTEEAASPLAQPALTAAVLAVVVMPGFVSRAMAEWVHGRNLEGRRMRGFDLSLMALVVATLCWFSSALWLDMNMAEFLVGLPFPTEGRVSRLLVSKINLVLSSFVLPLYVTHICLSLRQTTDDVEVAGLRKDEGLCVYVMELPFPWWKVFFVTAMGTLGKLVGCAAAGGLLRGLGWLEALALGPIPPSVSPLLLLDSLAALLQSILFLIGCAILLRFLFVRFTLLRFLILFLFRSVSLCRRRTD
ncbi:hypothetical protein E2562_028616 [Oryza meyeriana var. granulata]|uniref:Cation/H+ exchanger domain-containing protein n=1 Tax=Oryza meyeriana var. granulata TaxID=110450 RepID=A0A6G1FCU0_9ORYZ|nr:hypothetical protein E2562_028616 [Oryza meyeriana var. granulata]